MKKIISFPLIFCLIVLSGCSSLKKSSPETQVPINDFGPAAKLILEGHLVPESEITISALVNGRVNEILVSEDRSINQGELIVQIDGIEKATAQIDSAQLEYLIAKNSLDNLSRNTEIARISAQSTLAQAELNLIETEEAYDFFDTSAYQEKIDQSKIDIDDAEEELSKAKDDLEPHKDLDEDNLLRIKFEDILEEKQSELDDLIRIRDSLILSKELAKTKLELAEESVIEARFQLEQKQNGPDRELLELSNARLKLSESNLGAASLLTQYYQIESPISGIVVQLFVQEGDYVVAGQPILKIIDNSGWYIETTDLTELDLKNVKIGENVILTADAYPELKIEGVFEKISQWYYEKGGDIHYQGRIKVLKNNPEILWGMTFKITVP